MEPEWIVMRVAYMVLLFTLILMAWAYMIQSQEVFAQPLIMSRSRGDQDGNSLDIYPPCSFNPLCTCSKPGPTEFGIVACHHIPFGNIPLNLNSSRAFLLSMVGNNLQVLDDKRLVGCGLWRLDVTHNNLNYVAGNAFIGLSKFLSELNLDHNMLTTIPTTALRQLAKSTKFKILNLGYNRITDIYPDDLAGLPTSITSLGLAGNLITYIQEDAFGNLPLMERIDLSENSIQFVHPQAFTSLAGSLSHLYLANNLFQTIPFEALAHLQLKNLDMSKNLLTSTFDIFFERKLTVFGELNLEYNRISNLPQYSFQNFKQASTVRLANNPIKVLADDAFQDAKIDELSISNCFINEIHPNAFRGLENTLESLDLSFNNISRLPFDLFENFDRLRQINLDKNRLQLAPNGLSNFRLFSLHRFSVIGDMITALQMEDIAQMRNLRSLNISNFGVTSLTPQSFDGFGLAVEEVKISQGTISSINACAFAPLTGIKSLDLSDNRIERIDKDAFEGVGHSLQRLVMHNAVRMTSVPDHALQKLTAVRYLDLSNNGFSSISPSTFSESSQLTHLNLRFNLLTTLPENLFDSQKTPKLQRVFLSFNNIQEVKEETFARLHNLEFIELNENLIETIHERAFEDLTNLRILNLAGNQIADLKDEAFQNLPRLQNLDLSFNHLTTINIGAFEQLGTLSSFRINLSHNQIKRLINGNDMEASSDEDGEEKKEESIHLHSLPSISSSCIEAIDLSHNNLSFISHHFFSPISTTLIELILSDNRLQNLTLDHLAGMRFLQHLNLSNNSLETIEYNVFRESRLIQMINLDHNKLRDIPPDIFEGCASLRIFSAADNKIRSLADSIFKDSSLEIVNVGNNQLVRFPENALAHVASTLVKLDLSGNEISSLAGNQIECLQKLRWLDLSDNRILAIADSTFHTLNSLIHLDLSGNPMGKISHRLFEGIKDNLLHLHLTNMSLEILPDFESFPKLRTFNSSFNQLTYLPTNFGVNVSSLRTLDISGNAIQVSPNTIWHTIPRLSQVFMGDNPIKMLTNDSFLQLERLHELDISNLPLETVQVGVFSPLGCLKKLTVGPLSSAVNPGLLTQTVESLQNLHLKMDKPVMAQELRSYPIPVKVSEITISGEELLSISGGAFSELTGRQLQLTLQNTGLQDLSSDVLHELGQATQLSLTVKGNNSALKTIANPNAEYRREPFVTYLENLDLDENLSLSCSCESGWIEHWLREWMEETCPVSSPNPKDASKRCNEMLKVLRKVECRNKPGTNLMEAFISGLECGWKSSASFPGKFTMERFRNILLISFISLIISPLLMLRV